MKKVWFSVLIIFLFSTVFCSKSDIDSLKKQLSEESGENRIEILLKLTDKLYKKNPEKSIQYTNETLIIAKKTNNLELMLECYNYLGLANRYLTKCETAIQFHETALEIGKKIDNKSKIAASHHGIAKCCYIIGDYEKSLENYDKARKINNQVGNKKSEFWSLFNIGLIHKTRGNYDKAIEIYQQALVISEDLNVPLDTAQILNNIGTIYLQIANLEKALEYYESALSIRERTDDKRGIAASYNNIGNVYKSKEQYDLALDYFITALEINENIGNLKYVSFNLNNMGNIYRIKRDYEKALDCFKQSLRIKEKRNDTVGLAKLYSNIAKVYYSTGKFQTAIQYNYKSLEIASELGMKDQIKNCYINLSESFSSLGKYQKALEYHKLYSTLNDSLFNEEKFETITEIQTKYETEKKEKEIELLTKNSEIQLMVLNKQKTLRNIFIILFGIIIIVGLFIFKVKHREIRIQKEGENQIKELNSKLEQRVKDELIKREEQQSLLIQKSKLESLGKLAAGMAHEINQPLGGISMGLENLYFTHSEGNLSKEYFENKLIALKGYIDRIKQIINHIRIFSRDQQSPLFEKIDVNEVIKNALSMLQTQLTNHEVKLELNLHNNLGFSKGNKFKLEQVILNLLSNAKDAMEDCDKRDSNQDYIKQIRISTKIENSNLIIEIEDNGKGIKQENLNKIFDPFFTTKDPERGTGLGLSIVYGIIKEMQGDISVESKINKFTKFALTLPKV